MPADKPEANFLNLPTQWSLLQKAAKGDDPAHREQWANLLLYYHSAIAAYIHGSTDNREHADDMVQQFAISFLEGTFRHANREKGKFRHYLKASLSNFIRNTRQEQPNLPLADPLHGPPMETTRSSEDALDTEWQKKYLDAAWAKLRAEQAANGTPSFDVLKMKADNPELSSEKLAEKLTASRGEPIKPENIRQILKRSRHRFAEFLYEIVETSLDKPTPENVEEELADLNLLPYCQAVVQARKQI